MAKDIKNLTLQMAMDLLNNGNVLNYHEKYNITHHKTNEIIKSTNRNIYQLVKNKEEYVYYYYDCFGNKINEKTQHLNEDEIKDYILNPVKFDTYRSTGHWSYHKKRISKKSLCSDISNEEDLKYLIYDWLLKKNKDLVIIPEFTIANRRADYIAFDEKDTYLIEIKSEVDTLDRLEEQLKVYQNIGNFIYIAIHESKVEKIKKVNIPGNVGIFITSNKKMKLVKKATKNKIDKALFQSYVSSIEYLDTVAGLKYSSKFNKEQIIDFIDKKFTKKQRADFYYEVIRKRNTYESGKRKEAWSRGDYKNALGKASLAGVNRMNPGGYEICTLKSFFNIKHEILFDYFTDMENKFLKKYNKIPEARLLSDDPQLSSYVHDKYKVNLFVYNEFMLFEKLLANYKEVSKLWKNTEIYYNNFIENTIIEVLSKKEKLGIFNVYSQQMKEKILNGLKNRGFTKKEILLQTADIPSYENLCKRCIEQDFKFIIVCVKNRYTWGVKDEEKELYINRVIDFKDKGKL